MATGSADKTVRLWNVEARRELMQLDSGKVELGDQEGGVETLAFSPDGTQLLAGGYGSTAYWSAAPIVWNDPEPATKTALTAFSLRAGFAVSENRDCTKHWKTQPDDASPSPGRHTRTGMPHARWGEASREYDRLQKLSPDEPQSWLRTPGLIRVATALFHDGRPAQAATLLTGGAKRRTQDGLPSVAETVGKGAMDDPVTGVLWRPLLAAIEARLIKDPGDAGLLELRAELAGQWSGFEEQVASYTAAIGTLEQQKPEPTADLQRLYRRRGNAYLRLTQWQQANDDYVHGIANETTDEELLANQALARACVLLRVLMLAKH
jgi:hypothetical protein